jgi:hypothetical protein
LDAAFSRRHANDTAQEHFAKTVALPSPLDAAFSRRHANDTAQEHFAKTVALPSPLDAVFSRSPANDTLLGHFAKTGLRKAAGEARRRDAGGAGGCDGHVPHFRAGSLGIRRHGWLPEEGLAIPLE